MNEKILSFIRSLYPGKERIFLHDPCFAGNEKKYLCECIDTTFVSSVGAFVDRFERDIAAYTGATRAVVCANGTNALFMALMLAGVERGDEVLTQPLTFIATCNALSYIGAEPVFVDIERETLGLSPDALRVFLEEHGERRDDGCYNRTTGRRIRACVPMHTFGHPVRLDELKAVCDEYGLALVEDAAEAIGSRYKGRHVGVDGVVGILSFNGNKTITTGGGGMMLFRDAELGGKAKHLTTQAKVPHPWKFVHDSIGYNLRMPNINAALGCAQLEQLDGILENKRQTAEMYRAFFAEMPEVEFVSEPKGCQSNYWLNAVLFPNEAARDTFLEVSNASGIATRPVWELMNLLPMFAHCQTGPLPVAEDIAARLVNLPSGVR